MPEIRRAGSSGVKADIDIASSQFRALAGAVRTAAEIGRDYEARKQNAIDQGAISGFNNEQYLWDIAVQEKLKGADPKDYEDIVKNEIEIRSAAVAEKITDASDQAKRTIMSEWERKSGAAMIRAKGATERRLIEIATAERETEAFNLIQTGVPGSLEAGIELYNAMGPVEDGGDGTYTRGQRDISIAKAVDKASKMKFKEFSLVIEDPESSVEVLEDLAAEINQSEVLGDIQKKELNVDINKRKDKAVTEEDNILIASLNEELASAETAKEADLVAIPEEASPNAKRRIEIYKKKAVRKLKADELKEVSKLYRDVMLGKADISEIDNSKLIPEIPNQTGSPTKEQLKTTLSKTAGGLDVKSKEYKEVKKKLSGIIFDKFGDADLKDIKKAWSLIGIDSQKFDANASRELVQYAMLAESKLYEDGEIDVGGFLFDKDVTPEMQEVVDRLSTELDKDLGGKTGSILNARLSAEDVYEIWDSARAIINSNADKENIDPVKFYNDNIDPIRSEVIKKSVWAKMYSF